MTDQMLVATVLPEQSDPSISGRDSGWYKVAESQDIETSKAIQVDDFVTQLVVWRGEDKQLRALDLYCKHMGAALSCGAVEGNGIQCPFHSWRWSGDGSCEDIPYAKRIPEKAITRSWDIIEEENLVYVWFGSQGEHSDQAGKRFN